MLAHRPGETAAPTLRLVNLDGPETPPEAVRLHCKPQVVRADAGLVLRAHDAVTGAYLWSAPAMRMQDWLIRHGLACDPRTGIWRRASRIEPEAA